jgi:hypothetical protein
MRVVMGWLIDELIPRWDFRSRFDRTIAAEPAAVWTALHTVTYRELPLTRLLMTVRTAGRAKPDGTVAEGLRMPVLGHAEAREAVLGQVARYWTPHPETGPAWSRTPEGFARFAEPGWAKAAMSFQLTPVPGGQTVLAAETRVQATDATARRAFGRYWLLIRAGGAGLIRLELLRAIARRAESAEDRSPAALSAP